MRHTPLTDAEAVELFNKGDERGLNHFWVKHYSELLSYARKLTKDPDDCKDLVQNVYIKTYTYLYRGGRGYAFTDSGGPRSFFYTSLKNAFYDSLLRQSKEAEKKSEYSYIIPEVDEKTALHRLIKRETVKLLVDNMRHMPLKERAVISMLLDDGFSLYEVAKRTNTSINTVKNQRARAMVKFKNIIHEIPVTSQSAISIKAKEMREKVLASNKKAAEIAAEFGIPLSRVKVYYQGVYRTKELTQREYKFEIKIPKKILKYFQEGYSLEEIARQCRIRIERAEMFFYYYNKGMSHT